MVVTLKALAKMQYFKGLGSGELEQVKKAVAFEKVMEKGQTLLFEGDRSDFMYFIVTGAVKVYKKSANGKEQILSIATNGDSLNDVATFDGGGAPANMLAMTPVLLYAFKREDVERLFTENRKIARNVARVLASRIRRDSSLVEVLSFGQVMGRLARIILKPVSNGDGLLLNFTQQDLADMVGTNRVVVNRSLRVMEEKGAVRLERRQIVITDEEALKQLVNQ